MIKVAVSSPLQTQKSQAKDTQAKRFPVDYPDSDGKPMAETDKHRDLGYYFIAALKQHYALSPDTYISGNNFIYYLEGDRNARISPDCYVVFGVPMRQRNSYRVWEDNGHLPSVVFEFTSKKTQREDRSLKAPLYEQTLKVPEYFLFDPTGDYLKPRLQGYRLLDGQYHPLEMTDNRLYSEQLKLYIVADGEIARLYDPLREEYILSYAEQAVLNVQESARANTETKRADAETQARLEAEAEIAKLRHQLEAMKRTP